MRGDDKEPRGEASDPARGLWIEGLGRTRVGDTLGDRYRIDRVLGVGGIGVVVAATELEPPHQRVALKLLQRALCKHPVIVARFDREARAAATLTSEHVAKIIEVGELPEHGPYIALELLEGDDLEQVVERDGPLPIDVAVDSVLQACEAIAEAHRCGIIHRDLKPENLFVTTKGGAPIVKVLDFGISKILTDTDELTFTKSHDVMGSPLYMAPEQLKIDSEVDERTDIWALGAILFRLISGRTPFDAETFSLLTTKILVDPPRNLRRLRAEIPDGLASVIERCLAKEPASRFPDIKSLAQALEPFGSENSAGSSARVIAISNAPPPAISSPPRRSMAPVRSSLAPALPATAPSRPETRGPSRAKNLLILLAILLIVTLSGVITARFLVQGVDPPTSPGQ